MSVRFREIGEKLLVSTCTKVEEKWKFMENNFTNVRMRSFVARIEEIFQEEPNISSETFVQLVWVGFSEFFFRLSSRRFQNYFKEPFKHV